ncbi:MAG: tetratricopeptide repeat protein [Firmicutes bacterium]|nr:tetratricopeptide repeat protein [Bacillota bacterium]
MDKFIQKHPYLIISLLILVVSIVFRIPFKWVVLIYLAYAVIMYVTHLGTAVGWTGYILDGLFHRPAFTEKLYRFAATHDTKCVHALLSYGLDMLRDGRYQEGLDMMQRIVAMDNVQPLLLKYAEEDLALAYWKNGHLDNAIETMQMMESKYQIFSADFYTTFAYFYIEAGDYEKALEYTNKALDKDATHGPAFDNLGQIEYRQGHLEEAETYFLKALDMKDTMVDSKYHLGLIYEAWGNTQAAAEFFSAAHKSRITGMNTVTREQVDAKYNEYAHLLGASPAPASVTTEAAPAQITVSEDDSEIETEELSELASYASDKEEPADPPSP